MTVPTNHPLAPSNLYGLVGTVQEPVLPTPEQWYVVAFDWHEERDCPEDWLELA